MSLRMCILDVHFIFTQKYTYLCMHINKEQFGLDCNIVITHITYQFS